MTETNRVSRRERRVIVGVIVVVALAIIGTFVVAPFARTWMTREASIAAAREEVVYLEGLGGRTDKLEHAADSAERLVSGLPRRVLHARSEPLAASVMQSLLQDAADANHLLVTRIETADQAINATATARIANTGFDVPATVSAYGDIVGVVGFLHVLTAGPRVFMLDRLILQRNAALLGAPDVVQISVALRAPVLPE